VVLDAAAVAVAVAVAVGPGESLASVIGDQPVAGFPFLVVVSVATYLATVAIDDLPIALGARSHR
jgi:hypothetical protein